MQLLCLLQFFMVSSPSPESMKESASVIISLRVVLHKVVSIKQWSCLMALIALLLNLYLFLNEDFSEVIFTSNTYLNKVAILSSELTVGSETLEILRRHHFPSGTG